MSDIIMITGKILIDVSSIQDIKGLEYIGKPDSELTGKSIVRIFNNAKFIDVVCKDLSDAQNTYKSIQKSKPIVNIKEIRHINEKK